jgi:hypothetical protein
VANIAIDAGLGRSGYWATLPGANSKLLLVPIATAGIVSDATMRRYSTLAALVAGVTEQTTMGRKTLSSVTSTIDNTVNDRANVSSASVTWTAAAGAAISALVLVYDPDTTTSTDSTRIPIAKFDFVISPDGSDVTASITDLLHISSAA